MNPTASLTNVQLNKIDDTLVKCINTLRGEDNTDQEINDLLEVIAQFHDADRAYIFEFDEDMIRMDNTYEWCKEGVSAAIHNLKRLDIKECIGRWLVLFEEGDVYINSLNKEVSSDTEEYRLLKEQNVDSLMVTPLYLNKNLIGFLGVDNPRENTETLLLLRSVAALVANDIQKRQTLEQKVIGAISRVYLSVHLFSISQDVLYEYRCTRQIRQYISAYADIRSQLKNVFLNMTEPGPHRDGVLAFVDLDTLPERMRNTDYLCHEFYSVNQRWCRANFFLVDRDAEGLPEHVIFAVQLIDEEKRRELEYQKALQNALENQNEIYAEMLKMQGGGVIAYDVDERKILIINDAAREMLDFRESEEDSDFTVLMKRVLLEGEGRNIKSFLRSLLRDGMHYCEYAVKKEKGLSYLLSHSKLVTVGNGKRVCITSLMDVTENKLLQNQLLVQSRTDALTQINNRGYGEERIEGLLEEKVPGMFCLFDIDQFKSINDTFGHVVGDKTLISMAKCLKESFEPDDVVLRLGGDEFAIFVRGVETEEQGSAKIKRLFEKIEKIQIEEMGNHRICVSLGAVLCNRSKQHKFDELYQLADATMYICKRQIGNHFAFYRS